MNIRIVNNKTRQEFRFRRRSTDFKIAINIDIQNDCIVIHVLIRVVHRSDGPAGWVGSGHDFAEIWRVGSALQIFQFFTDYFLMPKSI